jgi:hypothetical protein
MAAAISNELEFFRNLTRSAPSRLAALLAALT